MAVTFPVPRRLVSLSLCRLDRMVPTAMIMEMIPAQEIGTWSVPYMEGQAAPSRESGSPKLIKDR